ncbi:DUF2063 domain-containing protein [Bordetella genomosp. 10]|uniref:DUF2063 domain-containing protein n=1 Tax=Bordetella genomosp. 10 TaxID=1416804 RepID=A0A261S0A4_9BORD|nr:DNA-binding domain-containing protein [Bordetella genomosp. 10]OZI30778.1 DUF2063 domain-containing protein [Bordetella genomosp. 10]
METRREIPALGARQRAFAEALLDPGLDVPASLTGPDGVSSARRFNVYRNNIVAGLVGALRAAYPAVLRITGDDFFSAMARLYAAREPPASPVMLAYGGTFPDFIQAFPPAASLPYLSDVARIERAWAQAYHAAEGQPADIASFERIDPRALPRLRFVLHPSVRIVRSSFPAVHIWLMNIDGGVPAAIDIFRGGECALVARPFAEVEVRRITAGTAAFILGLAAGAPVAEAAARAREDERGFDLARAFTDLFASRSVSSWRAPEAGGPTSIERDA